MESTSKKPFTSQQFALESQPLASILSKNLNHVINEGLLDSILPFICASDVPRIAKYDLHHICALKGKTGSQQSKPLCTSVQSTPATAVGKIISDRNAEQKEQQSRKKPNQSTPHLSKY